MAEHYPTDSKDDTPEYRNSVWSAVVKRLGCPITPLDQTASFAGTWEVSFECHGHWDYKYVWQFDGANIISRCIDDDGEESQATDTLTWTVRRTGQFKLDGRVFHAATSSDACLVLFNGDQSLLMWAEPRKE